VSFVAAIIQTLKADPPEMVNLIYNIFPTVNNGKQHKDNLIAITLPNILNLIRIGYYGY
jgi:hypothetical protein